MTSMSSAMRRITSAPRTWAACGLLAAAAAVAVLAGASISGAAIKRHTAYTPVAATHGYKPPKVRHIFVIVLENESYASTFGDPSADPYLAQTLPAQGALLEDYYASGHESNDNYISLVSGQPPNVENQADCQFFTNFANPEPEADGVEK